MEITDKNTEKIKLVPFAVIQKAVEGDIVSINKVLKHYEGYISCLAVRRMYDKYGNEYYCICLLYTSPSPRDTERSRMPSSA